MGKAQKQLLLGFSLSWLRILSGMIVPLIQTPYIFRYIESEKVGVWFLFFSIAFFIQMSDFGLSAALTRTISYLYSHKKNSLSEYTSTINFDLDKTILSSFSISVILSLTILFFITLFTFFFKPTFGLSDITEARNAFIIFCAGVSIHLMSITALSVLNGFGDVGLDNLCRTVGQLVSFIFILVFLPIYKTIVTLSAAFLLQSIFIFLLSCILLLTKYRNFFSSGFQFDFSVIKYLFKTGFPNFIAQVGTWLIFQSNIFIASALFGNSLTANYGAVRQLCMFGLSTILMIPGVISPFASSMYASNQTEKFKTLYYFSLKTSMLLIIIWCTGVFFWGEMALRFWIGSGHFLGYGILIPLLIAYVLEVHHSINATFVWSSGVWPFATTTIISGVLNVIFVYFFSKTIGIPGLAIGTLIAQLLTNNWYAVYVNLKRTAIKFKEYQQNILVPFSVFGLLLLLLSWSTRTLIQREIQVGWSLRNLSGQEIVSLLTGITVVCLFSAMSFYFFLLNKNEKKYLAILYLKHKEHV